MTLNEIFEILPIGAVVNLTLSGEFYCKFVIGNYTIQKALSDIKSDVMRIEYDLYNRYYNIDFIDED